MSSSARIIRAKHDKDNPYFMMRRDSAQDESLSWEARGMLCYLLSKPDDWEVNVKDLQQQCGQGRVYRIINELKDARYIKDREKKHNPETGKWEWTPYIVFEHPQPDNVIHITETVTRKPQHGNPDTVNREIIQSTEEQNTEEVVEAPPAPSVEASPVKDEKIIATDTDIDAVIMAWKNNTDHSATFETVKKMKRYVDTGIKLVEDLNATPEEVARVTLEQTPKPRTGAYHFWYVLDDLVEWRARPDNPAIQSTPAPIVPYHKPAVLDDYKVTPEQRAEALAMLEASRKGKSA